MNNAGLVRCTVSWDTRLGLEGTTHDTRQEPLHRMPLSTKRSRSACGARVAVRRVWHHFA